MRCFRTIIVLLFPLFLASCEGTTFGSSVPRLAVHLVIDTHEGEFVHFVPEAITTYIIADQEGYHYNGRLVKARPEGTYACGYGGVVVYININKGYDAYDLACPYCASRGLKQPCEINGAFAVCPNCHEEYDVASGTAAPQKGMIKETLRRLNIINSDGKLTITQKQ